MSRAVIDDDMQEYTQEKELLEEAEAKAADEEKDVLHGLQVC